MWYATLVETRQTVPPSKPDDEEQSDFPVDQAATADFAVPNQGILWHKALPCASERSSETSMQARPSFARMHKAEPYATELHELGADSQKTCEAAVPGSEYWLP